MPATSSMFIRTANTVYGSAVIGGNCHLGEEPFEASNLEHQIYLDKESRPVGSGSVLFKNDKIIIPESMKIEN